MRMSLDGISRTQYIHIKMAHLNYYNNVRVLVDVFYDSHVKLIEKVCNDLGVPEKAEELVDKYVDKSLKLKKFKDKNQPKKPKSAYMFFSVVHRKKLKEKSPDMAFGEIMKNISESWKKLNDKEKQKYNELAENDKERYQDEMEKYKSALFSSTTH